ncbi:MAG: acyl-CoA thioesterase [Actinomycetota bacterium]|nr:acyl-CoA thioesterase [Actinomycetota bacterium]
MNPTRSTDTPLVGVSTRPHPARLLAATYPQHDSVEARYGDMDANGHLNNLALEALHENARATMNSRVLPELYARSARRGRLVSANNVVHFLREAHWPNTIHTGSGVGRLGRTSFVASTALFLDGSCISLCDTVLVLLDDHGPTPIPDAARERLATLLLAP